MIISKLRILLFILFQILFIPALPLFGQITFTLEDCAHPNIPLFAEIDIVRENGKYLQRIKLKESNTLFINKKGTFRIKYNTIFGDSTILVVPKNLLNKQIKICANQKHENSDTTTSVISNLNFGQQAMILMSSIGCFHKNIDTLVIKKNTSNYTIIAKIFNLNINKVIEHSKILTENDMIVLDIFEKELGVRFKNDLIDFRSCTTQEVFEILSDKINRVYFHGSCSWNGRDFLIRSIFGKDL